MHHWPDGITSTLVDARARLPALAPEGPRLDRISDGVAAACGLGRRDSDEEAFDQMRETVALLEEPSTSMA